MHRILIHLDTDPAPSVFDRVVAIDAGADELFSYGGIAPENVEPLVHGAIFTRGPADLKHTAIFVGGSQVGAGEALFAKIRGIFFGPMRVSLMMDSNGSNTTAAAAVLAASKHVGLRGKCALVLGGTGPVGHRVAQLLAQEGAHVRLASRSPQRGAATLAAIRSAIGSATGAAELSVVSTATPSDLERACDGAEILIAAGAAGAHLLTSGQREAITGLKVAIDLNAVPPAGLAGIEVVDKAIERNGAVCYGAIGVGGTKMKIHRACVARLFESNDQILDTAAIYRIGQETVTAK